MANPLTIHQQTRVARALKNRPRDLAIWALSMCGLRSCEIASLTWKSIMNSSGEIADSGKIKRAGTKSRSGAREFDIVHEVREILTAWWIKTPYRDVDAPIAVRTSGHKARLGTALSDNAVAQLLGRLYDDLGFVGCSSHSGRVTWTTEQLNDGANPRYVQKVGGWSSLETMQVYWRTDRAAREKSMAITSAQFTAIAQRR